MTEILNSQKINASSNEQKHEARPLKLNKLTDDDDPLVFFEAAERLLATRNVPREQHASLIVETLSGKALQAYACMDINDVTNYGAIKQAVLKRFNVSAETSRIMFRESLPSNHSSFSDYGVKLSSMATSWVRNAQAHSFQTLFEMMVLEQFLSKVPEDLRVWLIDKKPANVKEASEFADSYCQSRNIKVADITNSKNDFHAECKPTANKEVTYKVFNNTEEKTRTPPTNGWRQNAGWRGPSNFIPARRPAPRQFVQRYQSQGQPRQANFEMQNNFNRDRMNDSSKFNTTASQFEQRPKNE